MQTMNCLDKGYVRLVDVMGSDLSVVNAARCSFAKEVDSLEDNDAGLIRYLARNGHTSPFRHAFATFEVKAPLMVARQWWKYVVGSDHTMDAWNEVSRRYVTMEPEFYIPSEWRMAPEHRKQGSGSVFEKSPMICDRDEWCSRAEHVLGSYLYEGRRLYNQMLDEGVCPEQARIFLPAYALYTVWRWSASLQSIAHFLKQRLAGDAQHEIGVYARAVKTLIWDHFPLSLEALVGE